MNMKEDIRQTMLANGLTSEQVGIVMDLAEQTVNECMATLDRVTSAAPEELYAHTVSLGGLLLEGHLHTVNAAVRKTLLVMLMEVAARG